MPPLAKVGGAVYATGGEEMKSSSWLMSNRN